jgi:preprotein translocase subunit YajC
MATATAFFAFILAKTTAPAKPSSSATGTLIFLVVIFFAAYLFILRPRTQAARRQRDTLMELNSGDEVLTASGIFGTVVDVQAERVVLETAPGNHVTVLRSTIARRMTEPEGNSVDEQNRQDEDHDGVAEAAGWHDPSEHVDTDNHDASGETHDADEHEVNNDQPEADGAPGAGQGGGR